MKKICSFFGHRDTSQRVFDDLYRAVKNTILEDGITKCSIVLLF